MAEMSNEQAARVLTKEADGWGDERVLFETYKTALRMGAAALRGPQPDPDTGLVPCGCGGKANIWPSDLRQAMVTDYEVRCTECAMTTGWVRGKQENAVKVWNRAMGYPLPPAEVQL